MFLWRNKKNIDNFWLKKCLSGAMQRYKIDVTCKKKGTTSSMFNSRNNCEIKAVKEKKKTMFA